MSSAFNYGSTSGLVLQDDSSEGSVAEVAVNGKLTGRLRRLTGRWTWYHLSTFLLTYFCYSFFHASRKNLSNVKSLTAAQWSPQNTSLPDVFDHTEFNKHHFFTEAKDAELFLGILDSVFLGAYAVGLFISGMLGDRYDPRLVLTAGSLVCGITLFVFGYVTEVTQFYNKAFYIVVYLVCGFSQSTGFPNSVAIVGNWFGKQGRGLILGLWASCQSVGNIIGSYLAAYFLKYGYEYTYLVSSMLMICGGCIVFFCVVNHPNDIGLPTPSEDEETEDPEGELVTDLREPERRNQAVGLLQAILIPGVLAYALAFACLKLVNYSFFYWLPYYLNGSFHWSSETSDNIATWYDWGGVVGGLVAGLITDMLGCRTPVVVVMLLASMGALFGYANAPNNQVVNGALMAVTGLFIGGPSNLITAAVLVDLGKHPKLMGNAKALATVTGIIDGTGSVGATVGQIVVPLVNEAYGWDSVFYVFIVLQLLTAVCLIPPFWRESKDLYYKAKTYFNEKYQSYRQ